MFKKEKAEQPHYEFRNKMFFAFSFTVKSHYI